MISNQRFVQRLLVILVILVWFLLVTTSYYVVHKPFSVENALAVVNSVGDVAVTCLLLVLAAAIGRRVLHSFAFSSRLQALALEAGLGLGFLSFATLFLGLVGLVQSTIFWVLLVLALMLLRRDAMALLQDLRLITLPAESTYERWLAIFCGLSLVLAFFYALTPPVAWDAQTYHLVEAKRALALGRITFPPDIVYFSFPSLVEMLFLAGAALKGDGIAALVHLGFLLLTIGLLFDLAIRFFNGTIAWLACAFVLAVPSLVSVSTWAYVDTALVFYSLAALDAVLASRQTHDRGWYTVAGAYAGLAAGVKYTGAIVLVALLVLSIRTRFANKVVHLAAAALCAAPWYLRNLAFTGNPFYPFLFGGPYWDAFRSEWFSRFGSGLINTPLQLVAAPWDATVLGTEGGLAYGATIGPLLLLLFPLLLFTYRDISPEKRAALRDILVFAGILYVFWLVGIAGSKLLLQTRLLFAAFPMLALGAAVSLEQLGVLNLKGFSLHRFARLVVMLVVGVTAISYLFNFSSNDLFNYLSGAESRQAFLARHLSDYNGAVQFINAQLKPTDKVLFLWEPRSYYVQRAVQPDTILDVLPHLRWRYHNADAIITALRAEGFTHVLLDRQGLNYLLQTGYDPITDEDIQTLKDMRVYLHQVYGRVPLEIASRESTPSVVGAESDRYAIYEIVGSSAAQK